MSWISDAWAWLLAMGVLVLFSALFSGSEAALFSLHQRGRRQLAHSGVGGRIASNLLQEPERLLSAILFWNLLINMTYFAIATIVGGKLETSQGPSTAVAFTATSLLAIIFFSEMLPKSVAVLAPLRISIIVSPPLSLAVRFVSPLLPLVNTLNLAVSRLLWPSFEPEPEIDLADIERAIELGTDDAALLQRERIALQGLVEMAETRVDELMRPRSKLWLCDDPSDCSVLDAGTPPGGYLFVTGARRKEITAAIGVRMLRPSQMDDLKAAVEPVIYVPWSALVSQVLDQLNDDDHSVAIVVDEFGEAIGALSVDDILRRVLAPQRGREEDESAGTDSIRQVAADHYRVLGSVSLRTLAKRLEIEVAEEGIATVAGYIQRYNERLPRVGDTAPLDGYLLEVVQQEDDATWIEVRPTPDQTESTEDSA